MSRERPLRKGLDWGSLASLHFKAKSIASGIYAGSHKSLRRGSGVEFGGHRTYVPGDDLRFLDYRAALRHDRLLVREFLNDTNRTLTLAIDASPSMGFRSENAANSKLGYACLIAAALGRVALQGGDAVGLSWLLSDEAQSLKPKAGLLNFERLVDSLERASLGKAGGVGLRDLRQDLEPIAHTSGRGSVIVIFSDFLDLPEGARDEFAALCSARRFVLLVQVLDPLEANFDLKGPVRLKSPETGKLVETNTSEVRAEYLAALERLTVSYQRHMQSRSGNLIRVTTAEDPLSVTRRALTAIEGAPR